MDGQERAAIEHSMGDERVVRAEVDLAPRRMVGADLEHHEIVRPASLADGLELSAGRAHAASGLSTGSSTSGTRPGPPRTNSEKIPKRFANDSPSSVDASGSVLWNFPSRYRVEASTRSRRSTEGRPPSTLGSKIDMAFRC